METSIQRPTAIVLAITSDKWLEPVLALESSKISVHNSLQTFLYVTFSFRGALFYFLNFTVSSRNVSSFVVLPSHLENYLPPFSTISSGNCAVQTMLFMNYTNSGPRRNVVCLNEYKTCFIDAFTPRYQQALVNI